MLEEVRRERADLRRVREGGVRARGEVIEVSGRVLYRDGSPQPNANGKFRILTIKPGLYPVDGIFQRSPHVHFDIRGRQRRLITQMYFDDTEPKVLAQDKLLQHDMWGQTSPLPGAIVAKLQKERSMLDPTARRYRFDIVL